MNELIIYDLDDFITMENDNFILGSFESFHLGHYQLLKEAQSNGGRIILVCFNAEKGMPKFKKKIFTDNYAKYEQLARLPFDAIVQLDFNRIKHLSGEDFLLALAQNHYVNFIAGSDFRFGNNASFTLEDFDNEEYYSKFKIQQVDLLQDINSKISTSKLKESLEFGDINFINSLLVFNYAFSGILNEPNIIKTIDNLCKIQSATYCALFHIGEFVYYGVMHISLSGVRTLKLIKYEINDTVMNTRVVVEVVSKIRTIISNYDDYINDEDMQRAQDYFARKIIENKK
ncbi:FAD synthase [Mycoplasmopsis verecunda]|uniref:FAD synthase n=1 Tax=Mycoplasmopsis verecunda TaxID=171291 RepID=A0A1T4KSX7_9BACT|nr:hypothetical protein [Mycoplasmopsis verecunda]WPB54667.1 hypothetical protein SAM46_00695 [Mycoplasmopsis verecunda]SJZ45526.1 riboflavin kinase / FMN adenylyltransferase [Mycoplasmopsis verecunda]